MTSGVTRENGKSAVTLCTQKQTDKLCDNKRLIQRRLKQACFDKRVFKKRHLLISCEVLS